VAYFGLGLLRLWLPGWDDCQRGGLQIGCLDAIWVLVHMQLVGDFCCMLTSALLCRQVQQIVCHLVELLFWHV
jgi:hypothetical protein